MKLKKDTKLIFGVNEGYSVAEVFRYYPAYIEWIMAEHSTAFIDDPENLAKTIFVTPFPSFKIEQLFSPNGGLPTTVNDVPNKYNSVAYALAFLQSYPVSLESLADDINNRLMHAYDLSLSMYETEMELYKIDPFSFGAPTPVVKRPELLAPDHIYEFSSLALHKNSLKKNNK
jgi:hypothetical protein